MIIQLFFIIAVGLAFGSFVTLASWRLPRGEDIVVKPSRCPECEVKLGFRDLWPVLSWALSWGKCRHCQSDVSVRYPLTELATASVFLLIFMRYGLTPQAGVLMVMAVMLLIMIVVDLEHYIIPDSVHVVLLPLGLLWHFLRGTPWLDVAEGAALGAAIGLSLHYGYKCLRKKDGLGFGDVKFFAVAGLWLGVLPIVPFLFFSGVLGVISGLVWRALGKGPVFPFGPSLAMALFLCVAYPEWPNRFWNIGQYLQ